MDCGKMRTAAKVCEYKNYWLIYLIFGYLGGIFGK